MLSELNYFLDYPVKFLFINSKGTSLIASLKRIDQNLYWEGKISTRESLELSTASASKDIYEKQIKRYFGLGFLSSFIPGTEAYTSRTEYFSSLLVIHKRIENNLSILKFGKNSEASSLTPLYFLKGFVSIYDFTIVESLRNITSIKKSSLSLLFNLFPIVSDIVYHNSYSKESAFNQFELNPYWYKHLVYRLLNPVSIVASLLSFTHQSFNVLFELGAKENYEASIPRQILKGLAALIFIPLRVLVGVIKSTVDLALNILDTLLLEPLRFGYGVVSQLIETRSEEFLYEPIEALDGVKNINYALANENSDISTNDKTFTSREYALKIVSTEEKIKYQEKKEFYDEMKVKKEFKNTDNFYEMSDKKLKKLSTYHEQFKQGDNRRKLGFFDHQTQQADKDTVPNNPSNPGLTSDKEHATI